MKLEIKSTGCDCGREHHFDSEVIIEEKALQRLPSLLDKISCKSPFIIADKNTFAAAGGLACELLEKNGFCTQKYVFDADMLEPDEANVGIAVMNFDARCDVVIGIGSGVINDISKIVANVSGKKYIIVATAPSMDGYASATSSMTVQGLKISLDSRCADFIIGDLDILCNAPMKLLLSGLGDMLAKYVSICEWRISSVINNEYYCESVACLVRASLKKCVDNADGLLRRDKAAVRAVFEGLVLCGAAMKLAGASRPASGIEHYFSHIWDMRGVQFGTPMEFHGIQCAVGTILSVELYEKLKALVPDKQKALDYVNSFDYSQWSLALCDFLGKGAHSMIALEKKERKYSLDAHSKRLCVIIEKWEQLLGIINEELPSSDFLLSLYSRLSLPCSMHEIGIDDDLLPMTFMAAKDIRDKYVLPRLCWDLGVIEEIL